MGFLLFFIGLGSFSDHFFKYIFSIFTSAARCGKRRVNGRLEPPESSRVSHVFLLFFFRFFFLFFFVVVRVFTTGFYHTVDRNRQRQRRRSFLIGRESGLLLFTFSFHKKTLFFCFFVGSYLVGTGRRHSGCWASATTGQGWICARNEKKKTKTKEDQQNRLFFFG